MNTWLIVVMLVLSVGFWVTGYMTGRETERMERRDPKPHHRANRDRVMP